MTDQERLAIAHAALMQIVGLRKVDEIKRVANQALNKVSAK